MGDVTSLPNKVELFPDLIPEVLRNTPRWLVWRWELNPKGKPTKPPFRVDGTKARGAVDPKDWVTFPEAVEACHAKRFSGIGFILTEEDDIYIYDLDHCLNPKNGNLEKWAEDIVNALNSYTEITPSGEGLRVFVRGDVPQAGKRLGNLSSPDGQRKGVLECYKDKRYITVTGNHFPGYPKEINDGSLDVWTKAFKKDSATEKKIAKDEKIARLFKGEWKDDYPSQSEADLAFCRYLAELHDGDAKRIDETFRTSGLYRPKWDVVHTEGRTYGAATIQTALSGYQKRTSLTDTGDAKRLAKLIGEEVRYCANRWYIWNGKRLEEDRKYAIYLKIDDLVKTYKEDAKEAQTAEVRNALISHAKSLESKSKTEAVLALTRSREPIPMLTEALDSNLLLFNCNNGIIDEGKLREHSFNEFMTKISPVDYDPKAKSPTWDKFLKEIIDDEEVERYLARAIGYSLTGLTIEQVIFFMYGIGANGKSTFLNAIMNVFGDYAGMVPTDILMASQTQQHPTGLSELRGIRMAVATEIEEGKRWNESLIKTLTGGERVKARRMYGDFFEFNMTAKLWVMGNHKPALRGVDYGIRRRFHFVPFTKTITKQDQDPHLPVKLEKEASGILRWAVEGYKDWKTQGLNPPKRIKDATDEYFKDMDTLTQFIEEVCDRVEGSKISHNDLFERYMIRSKTYNEKPMSAPVLARKLHERGFTKLRSKEGALSWGGLKFKQTEMNDSSRF